MNITPFISLPPNSELFAASASERRVSVGDIRDITLSIAARKRPPCFSAVPGGFIMSIGAAADDIGTHYRNVRATAEALRAGHGFEIRLTAGELAEAIALYAGHDVRMPYALTPIICTADDSDAFLVSCSGDEADGRLTSAYAYAAGNAGVRTLETSTILERSTDAAAAGPCAGGT